MSAALKIRPFKGNGEPGEDPEEYLDDVQMAAEAWENGKGDAAALEKCLLRFFRQNLEPCHEASWWWGGLTKSEKTAWDTVKALFLKKFADQVSADNDVNYEETNEVLGLSQKAGQSIEEYIREAENLHRKVRPVLKQTLAAAVIKGLADPQKRSNVSFALDGTTYDFNKAIDKIKASYRSIGEPDPFKKQKQWPSTNPFYSAPGGMGPPPIPVMAAFGHRRTSSYDNPSHQQMDNTLGRPSTADGTQAAPGKLSQQEFNEYMDNYVKRQKAQDFRLPAQGPTVTAPAARGTNPWVTCFTCGQKGHRSTECNGTPLSWEDQVKVREKVAMESQEYRARRASASGPPFAAPLSAANSVSLVKTHPVMERRMSGSADNTPQEQPRILPVNNIQLVRMGNSQSTTAAFAMLHRIPGVLQAIQNAAMAVKRGQEEAGIDQDAAKPPKLQRTDVGGEQDIANPPILQQADETVCPPAPVDVGHESQSTTQAAQKDMESLRRVISQEVDRAIQRVTMKDDTIIPPPEIPIASKPRTHAPIRLMQNEPKYDIEAVLRDIIPKISLPQLLDISPSLRQELKDLLQSTIPRLRRKRTVPLAAFNTMVKGVPPAVTSMAKDDKDVSCLYIDCFVGGYKVTLTLVDGGAQIELVSESVIRKIGCKTYSCKDTAMRLANDSVVPLPYYAWLDINVCGVLARIKAYVMPIEMSFLILLSRRWLSRVQAVEDHANNTIHIKGVDGVVHLVRGSPAPAAPSIGIASQQLLDLDDDLQFEDAEGAEQAIDILLDNLDHWEEEDLSESGNGLRLR
jgi:hypothetical protein